MIVPVSELQGYLSNRLPCIKPAFSTHIAHPRLFCVNSVAQNMFVCPNKHHNSGLNLTLRSA
jgi:hypothetical protein